VRHRKLVRIIHAEDGALDLLPLLVGFGLVGLGE
jgi:hypothetical protein